MKKKEEFKEKKANKKKEKERKRKRKVSLSISFFLSQILSPPADHIFISFTFLWVFSAASSESFFLFILGDKASSFL